MGEEFNVHASIKEIVLVKEKNKKVVFLLRLLTKFGVSNIL